jgi:hypothetical protein
MEVQGKKRKKQRGHKRKAAQWHCSSEMKRNVSVLGVNATFNVQQLTTYGFKVSIGLDLPIKHYNLHRVLLLPLLNSLIILNYMDGRMKKLHPAHFVVRKQR